jgi:hypothetical protein
MRYLRLVSSLAALLLALVPVSAIFDSLQPAAAQATNEQLDAILADIEKKADQYARFRLLLSDPDQAKRMAAFNAMTNSGILELHEMALNYAFDSGDPAIQSVALQVLLTNTKALTFYLDPSNASEQTKKALSRLGGGFSIKIDSWDAATASFSKTIDNYTTGGTRTSQWAVPPLYFSTLQHLGCAG